jgi:hypothetical protein
MSVFIPINNVKHVGEINSAILINLYLEFHYLNFMYFELGRLPKNISWANRLICILAVQVGLFSIDSLFSK